MEPQGGFLFSPGEGQTFENVDFSQGKKGPTWEGLTRDLQGTCEGTDSGEER